MKAASRLATPLTAGVAGGLVLALIVAEPPLALLARHSINTSNGSVPVWFSAALAAVGFVVAWRKPLNPLGWIIIATAGLFALSQDASFYVVAAYQVHHGGLPLSSAALFVQPAWSLGLVLLGLVLMLFPDGQLPGPRWRWLLWPYLALAGLWTAGTVAATASALAGHHVSVDSSGNLLLPSPLTGFSAWWHAVNGLFFPLLALGWLMAGAAQIYSYRHASAERRQQLKWLLAGAALAGVCLAVAVWDPFRHSTFGQILGGIILVGVLAIPVCLGVAILEYRLNDIDRISAWMKPR